MLAHSRSACWRLVANPLAHRVTPLVLDSIHGLIFDLILDDVEELVASCVLNLVLGDILRRISDIGDVDSSPSDIGDILYSISTGEVQAQPFAEPGRTVGRVRLSGSSDEPAPIVVW